MTSPPTALGHLHRVDGTPDGIDADVIVGCDGSFGPSRAAIPDCVKQVRERTYPVFVAGCARRTSRPRPTN